MPHCLILAPFPMAVPRHGGQVRAASILQALQAAGWEASAVGVYHAGLFGPEEWGPRDIILTDPALAALALDDLVFADLHVARAAAADPGVVRQLRQLLSRLRPDVVHVEHPWDWPLLQQALDQEGGPRPKVVYSSQNIEWSARPALLKLGLQRPGAAQLTEATRLLEAEFARAADLVLSISDLEAEAMAAECGRPVSYLPAMSDLVEDAPPLHGHFQRETVARGCRYAALMGSAYWPNVEGFFTMFPHGLGFLAQGEQIWVAGGLGPAVHADPRFKDFLATNDARYHHFGYVQDADKPSFFASAACAIVPVCMGAGAKLKTADAVASGCPVIATSHAIEGYGPLLHDALDRGVYVADAPRRFQLLIRRAMHEGLPGCTADIRQRLGLTALSTRLASLFADLLAA